MNDQERIKKDTQHNGFMLGEMHGKIEAVAASIEKLQQNSEKAWKEISDQGKSVAVIASSIERMASDASTYLQQCNLCQREISSHTSRITRLEEEIETDSIRKKINPALEKKTSNRWDIFNIGKEGVVKGLTYIIGAAVVVAMYKGAEYLIGGGAM